ncbi:MAG: CDP-glucose 4,6-dehydratase, partial [Oscillospiraceae bacterium]
MKDLCFYKNKNVFVTGHTGFKGTWLCKMLIDTGANVTGYSLVPPTNPSLFQISRIDENINSVIGDIRDYDKLFKTFKEAQPEIVLHLAAQPIVRDSYKEPAYTYETNVMGTVNILECVRNTKYVKSFLNITTDKVYQNNEWEWGYREIDALDGFDPYSNSKSCSELVTHGYKNSFFADNGVSISTARAGNVIGGGDFANDRIIPDCMRAVLNDTEIIVRNPFSTRPYQHVLEPLSAYLMIAQMQYDNNKYAGYYNIGPDECDCVNTGELVDTFCKYWGGNLSWKNVHDGGPHEANFLKLDCSKLKSTFNWSPKWHIDTAIEKTVDWIKAWQEGS